MSKSLPLYHKEGVYHYHVKKSDGIQNSIGFFKYKLFVLKKNGKSATLSAKQAFHNSTDYSSTVIINPL